MDCQTQKIMIRRDRVIRNQSIAFESVVFASTFKCKIAGTVKATGAHKSAPSSPINLSSFSASSTAITPPSKQTANLEVFTKVALLYLSNNHSSIIMLHGFIWIT